MLAPIVRDRRHLLLIPLAALFVIHPLLAHGPSCGHDLDFHLVSWFEAATQLAHGNLLPHWAFTPAFNAGEPRFIFYPPISWYLGALLGLILTHLPTLSAAAGWTLTPALFTFLALTASGLTLHHAARTLRASPNAALFASILYLANPYMLFTAYERTAYAELLAAAFIPLLLLAILRPRPTIPGIALPLALLWLTNDPAAVMSTYALAFLAVVRLLLAGRLNDDASAAPRCLVSETWASRHKASLRLALTTLAGTALGLALAAVYLLPAIYERHLVQLDMTLVSGYHIADNTLFHHTGLTPDDLLHDAVLHTASLIAVLLLIATAVALIAALLRRRGNSPIVPLAILAAAIAFALTRWSLPLWHFAPEAAFLQFPWRLLAILAAILALAAAAALTGPLPSQTTNLSPGAPSMTPSWVERKPLALQALITLLFAAALTVPAYRIFHQPCDDEDTPSARFALYHSNLGTDPTDEYTPASADNDALHPNDPPYWLAATTDAPPPPGSRPGQSPRTLVFQLPRPEFLILNRRDYPAWRVTRNGAPDPGLDPDARPDGLIVLPLPAGRSILAIHYAQTFDQTTGEAITFLALLIFLLTLRRKRPA